LTPRGDQGAYCGQVDVMQISSPLALSPKGHSVKSTSNPTLADGHLQRVIEDIVNTNWSDRMMAVRDMMTDLERRLKELESIQERCACKLEMREWQTPPITALAHLGGAENSQQQQQAQQKQAQQKSFCQNSTEAELRKSDCRCAWLGHFEDLRRELSNLERRFEKLEIKNMEERISKKNWLLPPLQQTSHIKKPSQVRSESKDVAGSGRKEKGTSQVRSLSSDIIGSGRNEKGTSQIRSLSRDIIGSGRKEKGTSSDGRADTIQLVDADHNCGQDVSEDDQHLKPWAETPTRNNLGDKPDNANCFCLGQDRGKDGPLEALRKWAVNI